MAESFCKDPSLIQGSNIGIIGTGTMGVQISVLILKSGYKVVLKTRSFDNIEKTRDKIRSTLQRKLPENESTNMMEKLSITTDFADLKDCNIILEVVKEDYDIKIDILNNLSEYLKIDALVFSNSSSMNIEMLSNHLPRKENFLGFHLFNPVEKMRLVEIVTTPFTGSRTIAEAFSLAETIGKTPVKVKDSPGYIVNRLLFLQINEAIKLLDQGISKTEDIDQAVKLGLNHPLGPLELADLIGLDVCLSILKMLEAELENPSYRPCPLLDFMVLQENLGRKSGKGFYDYPHKS